MKQILIGLGNLPLVYMTGFNGWMHDRLGPAWMLLAEAALGVSCVALMVLARLNVARAREPMPA